MALIIIFQNEPQNGTQIPKLLKKKQSSFNPQTPSF